jgi:hypothetical protein
MNSPLPKPTPQIGDFLTPEIVRGVQNYLIARTHYEAKRAEVQPILRQILTERVLMATLSCKHTGRPPYRIVDPKDLFLCEDDAACREFYAEGNRRERAAGVKPANMPDDHCPECVAHSLLIEAENVLIDEAGRSQGIDSSMLHLEKRAKFLDLVCGLVVNHPRTARHFASSETLLSRYK